MVETLWRAPPQRMVALDGYLDFYGFQVSPDGRWLSGARLSSSYLIQVGESDVIIELGEGDGTPIGFSPDSKTSLVGG